MPSFQIVERDYTAIAEKLAAIGPLADKLGFTVKNITYRLEHQLEQLAASSGVMLAGAADGAHHDVPKSEATGRRGGVHNSATRLLVKPSHLIGAYNQLSYTFNYPGPTGNQRDMVSTIRRRSPEAQY
jgi:nitrate reductase alpha subunit